MFWLFVLLGKEPLVYHCIGGFVGLRTVTDVMAKKNQ
jgi:hypothetical protein